MLQRLIPAALFTAALGWAVSYAQPPADPVPPLPPVPKAEPKAAPKADEKQPPTPAAKSKDEALVFELRTLDDTVMKVTLLEPTVTVVTKYGKLSIPANEVRRLEFGFRYPEGVESKIDRAIADLSSMEFRTREDAEQTLAEIGHFALPNLRRVLRNPNPDPEVVKRITAVLKNIEGKFGDNKPELRDYDTVETAEFTAKGKLELSALKIRTKYFGDTTVKLTDIKTFRSAGSSSQAEFNVDAGKYAKMNQADWMETTIEVFSGQQLQASADGKIDQWPQGPGQYMCGPDGINQGGGGFPGGVRVGLPGQLMGKIGANGTPFALGANYKGKVGDTGKLYVRIGPSPWNCDSTGSYKVKVEVTSP